MVWDTDGNIAKANRRLEYVLKGCKCKTGCTTLRCKCRKNHSKCGPGCQCTGCANTYHQEQKDDDLHHMELEEMNDDKKEMVETSDEEDIEDDDEVNEILSHVFCDSEQ